MSLLEDARRLAEHEPIYNNGSYGYCGELARSGLHASDCPWLAMPRIVAALEAAERMQQALYGMYGELSQHLLDYGMGAEPHPECRKCGQVWPCDAETLRQRGNALIDTLKDEAQSDISQKGHHPRCATMKWPLGLGYGPCNCRGEA